ncbi:MAG: sigma-70 family RNA polymerase sigma factor [Clostridia bacterium]|nr:sigma-70 family RNA polymerase sigma factor [Clostridia bacterium]MBQ6804672.1 sigma-70 family RNA polymerase sigma factor [Clostridia bacterium]MDD6682257.1 DUF1492 domain-containing protein [Clostridiales bacterium]
MTAKEIFLFSQSSAGMAMARDFLSGALHLDNIIAMRLARLDVVRNRATKVNRVLTGIPGSGQYSDLLGETAAELADLEAELLQDYHQLLQRQREIDAAIRRIPDERQRAVLEMRYLQQKSFAHIAIRLSYDERQIYRLHAKGLRHIAAQMAAGEIEWKNFSDLLQTLKMSV